MSRAHELNSFNVETNRQAGSYVRAQFLYLWYRLIHRVFDLPREETYKPIHRLHDVDIVEGQGIWGTWILHPPQLLEYLYGSEDPTYVLFYIT